jgi:hypothetical protein
MFLKALRKVALSQARPMTEIAEACGVSRESLYRMLSEAGNPTSENRRAILAAMGLKSIVVPIEATRIITGGAREDSGNVASAKGNLEGNTISGDSYLGLEYVIGSGLTTLSVPVRKAPVRALGNFTSVGRSRELAQTGVRQ